MVYYSKGMKVKINIGKSCIENDPDGTRHKLLGFFFQWGSHGQHLIPAITFGNLCKALPTRGALSVQYLGNFGVFFVSFF